MAVRPRYRALLPRQLDDSDALDQLGVRLDAYIRIETPIILLTGDRSPAHLGERLDTLARRLPHAEKVVMHGKGHAANQTAPGEVARIIETLADRVLWRRLRQPVLRQVHHHLHGDGHDRHGLVNRQAPDV